MRILIEKLSWQPAKNDRDGYYIFWVRFFLPDSSDAFVTVGGWRYWPKTDKLSTPSLQKSYKDDVRHSNTAYVSKGLYDNVLYEIRHAVGPREEVAA